jgi:hypothetical protein
MKLVFLKLAFVFSTALIGPVAFCRSVCNDGTRIAVAEAKVREDSGSASPLQVAPLPGLTDSVVYLKTRPARAFFRGEVPVVCFYHVTIPMYELEGRRILSESVELGTNREWLVALDVANDLTVVLEGSKNATANFNRLVGALDFNISNPDDAIELFDFFLKVAKGDRYRFQVVGDEMALESVALEDFRLRLPSNKRRPAFEAWWKGVSDSRRAAIQPPRATKTKDGYEVRYLYYNRGNLWSRKVLVRADGTLVELSYRLIVSERQSVR